VKRAGILNGDLSYLVATLGHTDVVAVADAGLPIPDQVWRIDLALVPGIPGFVQTLRALLAEVVVERAVIAAEMAQRNPEVYRALKAILAQTPIDEITHEALKTRLPDARAVIRTGECTPFANVLLQCGVAF
jgi:D-ribose pyranase